MEAVKWINCWESKKCGREPNGPRASEMGVCPASTEARAAGINHGKNGGRACWAITGTFCGGKVQGSFATKLGNCLNCDFYKIVLQEEGTNFQTASMILKTIGG